jgi:hypothetical protein
VPVARPSGSGGVEEDRLAGDPVGKLVSQRRAAYYGLVANAITGVGIPSDADLPAATALNNITQLYQAFAQLALPRAMKTDDQLHALVFGTHSLIADTADGPGGVSLPLLSAAYVEASQLESQNGYNSSLPLPVLDESSTGGQPVYCNGYMDGTNDMVAKCLTDIGRQRANRLYATIAGHFQSIAAGAETETQRRRTGDRGGARHPVGHRRGRRRQHLRRRVLELPGPQDHPAGRDHRLRRHRRIRRRT